MGEKREHDGQAGKYRALSGLLQTGGGSNADALPDGKHLYIGKVGTDSPCSGSALKEKRLLKESDDYEIVAILREEHLILPHPHSVIETGDKLLVLASALDWANIKRNLSSPA